LIKKEDKSGNTVALVAGSEVKLGPPPRSAVRAEYVAFIQGFKFCALLTDVWTSELQEAIEVFAKEQYPDYDPPTFAEKREPEI
jgi:hypothetical protein